MTGEDSDGQAIAKDARSDSDGLAKSKDSTPTAGPPTASATEPNKSPRKRRKVNHGMLCFAA